MAGIYVHIPFCKQACHYCDFHFSTSLQYAERMVEAMLTDARLQATGWKDTSFSSVYFGGGTPSVLTADALEQLMRTLHTHYRIEPDAELTLETNPDDVSTDALADWQSLGFNRFSVGIQSFDPDLLRAMNRSHSAEQAAQALAVFQLARVSYTADLIYGQPEQSMDQLQHDLRRLMQFVPQHISAYCLTVEPQTVLDRQVSKGHVIIPDDPTVAQHYALICEELARGGFVHYEVSNWSLPGWASRHNSAYWAREPYVGIGPSAHGFRGNQRYWNTANNGAYMREMENESPTRSFEELSRTDHVNEQIMVELRTAKGIDPTDIERSMLAEEKHSFQSELKALKDRGVLTASNGRMFLSEKAMLTADRIASNLFLVGDDSND